MSESDTIGKLATALSVFQGKDISIKKDGLAKGEKFSYKYATLDVVWDAARLPLAECGLSVTQIMDISDTDIPFNILITKLMHSSGEWISGQQILKPVQDNPQGMGSAITYAKRYGLCAILGIVADEDDDANSATKKPEQKGEKPIKKETVDKVMAERAEPPDKAVDQHIPRITEAQLKKIFATLKEKGIPEEDGKKRIYEMFNVKSTTQLSKDQASKLIEILVALPDKATAQGELVT